MKVVSIVGARPQFVKAAVVSPCLKAAGITEELLHTGQHYDAMMSDAFFEELPIPPATWSLGVGSGSHATQTAAMLTGIEQVLLSARPDVVLVYGDTNSTLAGALAAAKVHIPVAHVEAGLRSFNRRMPEEINRIVADRISDVLFVPTAGAQRQLELEGVDSSSVFLVGDVMFDLALTLSRTAKPSTLLADLGLEPGGFVLATVHRAENTDDPDRFEAIVKGFQTVSDTLPVVWPVHPRARQLLSQFDTADRLRLIDPIGYSDMMRLEQAAAVVATDSGGVQKEAFFHGCPCVTLRDETEWVELVELGWNRLVPPTNPAVIAAEILSAIGRRGRPGSPYGTGEAGAKIADIIVALF